MEQRVVCINIPRKNTKFFVHEAHQVVKSPVLLDVYPVDGIFVVRQTHIVPLLGAGNILGIVCVQWWYIWGFWEESRLFKYYSSVGYLCVRLPTSSLIALR